MEVEHLLEDFRAVVSYKTVGFISEHITKAKYNKEAKKSNNALLNLKIGTNLRTSK